MSGVCEGARGKDDEERQEDGEHAGEGGALLSALERAARDTHLGFWMLLISVFLRVFL